MVLGIQNEVIQFSLNVRLGDTIFTIFDPLQIYGQPETTQKAFPLHTCAYIDPALITESPNWSAEQCREKKQFVCQKTTFSQCPDGWYLAPNESGGKCMQFYVSGSSHKVRHAYSFTLESISSLGTKLFKRVKQ